MVNGGECGAIANALVIRCSIRGSVIFTVGAAILKSACIITRVMTRNTILRRDIIISSFRANAKGEINSISSTGNTIFSCSVTDFAPILTTRTV